MRVVVTRATWEKVAPKISPKADVKPEAVYEDLNVQEIDPTGDYDVHCDTQLVTVRDGKTVTSQEEVSPGDLRAHIPYLLGEGPRPATRAATPPRAASKPASADGPIAVNEVNFDRAVLHSDRPVLVDFWAAWCAPCRMVEPTVNALAREQGRSLKVVKVNVDENPGLASRYGAMSIPMMIVVKGGREVDRWVGAQPEHIIRSRVARWIQSKP